MITTTQFPRQWQPGNTVIEPGTDFIDLWRVDLSDPDLEQQGILTDDEYRRADKFAFDTDRNNFVRSRCTLRRILAGYLDCPANRIESLLMIFIASGIPASELSGSEKIMAKKEVCSVTVKVRFAIAFQPDVRPM